MPLNENQTRKQLIDSQIAKAGWNLSNLNEVRFEVPAGGDDDDWTDGITDYNRKVKTGKLQLLFQDNMMASPPTR